MDGCSELSDSFAAFFTEFEPRLRRALVAAYGPAVGRDAAAEALALGWERWERIRAMSNPVGYLYRVGQTAARRLRRPEPLFPAPPDVGVPWVEPHLPQALTSLSEHQRVAVVLAVGFGFTHREVGDVLGVSPSTVQNHVERGLAKLRVALEVNSDA